MAVGFGGRSIPSEISCWGIARSLERAGTMGVMLFLPPFDWLLIESVAAGTDPSSGGLEGWGKGPRTSVGTQSGPGLVLYIQVGSSRPSMLQNHLMR